MFYESARLSRNNWVGRTGTTPNAMIFEIEPFLATGVAMDLQAATARRTGRRARGRAVGAIQTDAGCFPPRAACTVACRALLPPVDLGKQHSPSAPMSAQGPGAAKPPAAKRGAAAASNSKTAKPGGAERDAGASDGAPAVAADRTLEKPGKSLARPVVVRRGAGL